MVSPCFGMLLTPSDDSELCGTLQYRYSDNAPSSKTYGNLWPWDWALGWCNTLYCTMLDQMYMACTGNWFCATKGSDDDYRQQN